MDESKAKEARRKGGLNRAKQAKAEKEELERLRRESEENKTILRRNRGYTNAD